MFAETQNAGLTDDSTYPSLDFSFAGIGNHWYQYYAARGLADRLIP
nr:hypothetical protein [Neisseria weixii]